MAETTGQYLDTCPGYTTLPLQCNRGKVILYTDKYHIWKLNAINHYVIIIIVIYNICFFLIIQIYLYSLQLDILNNIYSQTCFVLLLQTERIHRLYWSHSTSILALDWFPDTYRNDRRNCPNFMSANPIGCQLLYC